MTLSGQLAAIFLLIASSAPLGADPPADKPLPGERVGGEGQDIRASKRIDTRLPTRLNTRVQPRTIGRPLVAATSQIISDAENGCTRSGDRRATQTTQTCQTPQ